MTDTRFTTDHEYVRLDGDAGVIGVTDYAQSQLGDIVFIELPPVGKKIAKGEQLATVESVKAASEVFSPVSGEVVEVNGELDTSPPETFHPTVVQKYITRGKGTSYHMVLSPWGSHPGEHSVDVKSVVYNKYRVGDVATVDEYSGFFHIPYFFVW